MDSLFHIAGWRWLFDLADWVIAVGVILTVIGTTWRSYSFVKRKMLTVMGRIDTLENHVITLTHDVKDSTEERIILMGAMKATLEAVSLKRCNGNVDDAIKDIDDYMILRSHEPKTNLRKAMDNENE